RHTMLVSDWSSDVCSSDLPADKGEAFVVPPSIGLSNTLLNQDHHEIYFAGTPPGPHRQLLRRHGDEVQNLGGGFWRALGRADDRSEERRVGEEGVARGGGY